MAEVNGIDAIEGLVALAKAIQEFEFFSTAIANLKRRLRDTEDPDELISLKGTLRRTEQLADKAYRSMVNKAAIVLPKVLDTKCQTRVEKDPRDHRGD